MWGGGGPSAVEANKAAGLPFAGIPSELAEGVEKIVAKEPEHPPLDIHFSQIAEDDRPFTLWRFLSPYRFLLFLAFLLVLIETISLQITPRLISWTIDNGIRAKNFNFIIWMFICQRAAILLNYVSRWGHISFTGRLSARMMLTLRVQVFSHFQRLSLDFFTSEKAGRLLTRMTSDIETLTSLFEDGIVQLVVQGLSVIIIGFFLFWLNPKLAVITIVLIVPVMTVLTWWFTQASDRGYLQVRDRIADVLSDLSENLSGIRIIAAYNRRRHNIIHHNNVVGEYFDANMYTAKIGAFYGSCTDMIGIVGRALLILFGGWMVLNGKLQIGELVGFLLYFTTFFAPIQQLVGLYNQFQAGQAAVKKLRDLFSTQSTVPESPDAVVLPLIKGDIQIENVCFSYTPDTPVLKDIHLHIKDGETFAFVGPTGAGKSTIAKLITRFYDPTSGRISIDGFDLKDVTLHSLRSQLGVVPQEAFLFHGSIRDNVAFSRPDASDEDIMEACRAVGIDDLIDRLPLGIDTLCHERGVSLSSGERQLIALARAFLAQPRVLVLDEATSNLDLKSESKIENALDVLLEGRTAIIIAHRLATAMRGDRIAVVDGGRIIELGSHDELVAKNGKYAEMYATYLEHMDGQREAVGQ
jgi:ATP-binding cassette subfamily B protein